MTISPKVTLRFADGTKRRIELYDRPSGFTVNLRLDNGELLNDLHFRRTGPDEYTQKVFVEGEEPPPNE